MSARRLIVFAGVAVAALADAQAPSIDPYLEIPEGGGPIDPGPIPPGIDAIDAAACGECHRTQFAEWSRSAHHTSFTNALFTDEHRRDPRPFCARCHAPRQDAQAGVDCAVCHVRDGVVLNPTISGRAPHASRASPEVAGTLACARCHQFEFEGHPGHFLQRTVEEWMASPHRDTSCQGCHVPARATHHAHDFPGGLDPTLLRDAITVRASAMREGGITRVVIELSANGAGHAVPTGDVFRRIEVRAWPAGSPSRAESATLGRRFAPIWRERSDNRVPPAGVQRVELDVDAARRIEYSVDLWRTLPERAEQMRWPARDVRRRLAEGVITAR